MNNRLSVKQVLSEHIRRPSYSDMTTRGWIIQDIVHHTCALGFTYAHKGYHRIDRISHQSHTRSLHKATPAQVPWQPVSIVIECLVMQITSNVLKEHYIAFVHDLQILRICLTRSDAHRPHTRSSHTQRYYASGTDYFRQQVPIVVRYHPSASVLPHCDYSCIVSGDYRLRLG